MPLIAEQVHTIRFGSERNVLVDYSDALESSELIASVETDELGSSDLTLESAGPSEESLIILGRTVAAGKAAQFRVSGGVRGSRYIIELTVTTDADDPQVFVDRYVLEVI